MLFCDVTGEVAILDTTETSQAEPARQQEFGQFMTARWPGLVRLAYGLTGDRWLAEDVAQAALASPAPATPPSGVSPDVTRLTVGLRDGRTLALRPVPVQACGRRLPLAGFSYARSGVATITAYAGAQVLTRVTPPASLFTGAGSCHAARHPRLGRVHAAPGARGVAAAVAHAQGAVASGVVASGRLDGTRWRISVQLGAAGDCFLGATFDGHAATQATYCCRSRSRPLAPARCSAS